MEQGQSTRKMKKKGGKKSDERAEGWGRGKDEKRIHDNKKERESKRSTREKTTRKRTT